MVNSKYPDILKHTQHTKEDWETLEQFENRKRNSIKAYNEIIDTLQEQYMINNALLSCEDPYKYTYENYIVDLIINKYK